MPCDCGHGAFCFVISTNKRKVFLYRVTITLINQIKLCTWMLWKC